MITVSVVGFQLFRKDAFPISWAFPLTSSRDEGRRGDAWKTIACVSLCWCLELSISGTAALPRKTELDAGETHQSRLWIVFAFIPMRTYA